MDGHDVIGSILIFFGLVIAASGGIGGGGIIVPVLMLVFSFNSEHAIPLSNITIFGSSLANLYINAGKNHPEFDRPVIDWDAVLMMEPLTMIGLLTSLRTNTCMLDEQEQL